MLRKRMLLYAAVGLVVAVIVSSWTLIASSDEWSIKADIAESCSCNPACPCIFGSAPTMDKCEGSRLIEIEEGHFDGVQLHGIKVVVAFRMGTWAKYYISDEATEEQAKAAEKLISKAFPDLAQSMTSAETVPISVERTSGRLKFTAPTSTVELEVMEGKDGKPVTIGHLKPAFLQGYTQYVSVENSHHSDKASFKYSGTNGFTSRIEAGN